MKFEAMLDMVKMICLCPFLDNVLAIGFSLAEADDALILTYPGQAIGVRVGFRVVLPPYSCCCTSCVFGNINNGTTKTASLSMPSQSNVDR